MAIVVVAGITVMMFKRGRRTYRRTGINIVEHYDIDDDDDE